MKINKKLKDNLIADVENILEINLSSQNKEALKRVFEITIGAYLSSTKKTESHGFNYIVKVDDDFCEWEFGFTTNGNNSIDDFIKAIESKFKTKRTYQKLTR